eukprot:m.1072388 g.1072388  ORF g.1072388 m.1072388 type:complete len:451 (-) comp24231_c0_seq113:6139-7491(-)
MDLMDPVNVVAKSDVVVCLDAELPPYDIKNTPSRLDGVSEDLETDLRIWGCFFIQDTGILLELPQVVMACAQILFQRFYYRKSMTSSDVKVTAIACLFLAAKVEESQKSIRNILQTAYHVEVSISKAHVEGGMAIRELEDISRARNDLIKAERRVLKELGFCVHLKHPHKLIISYQKLIGLEDNKELAQLAWNYMNDGLKTSVFIQHTARTIACACLHLATIQQGLPMPDWWIAFDAQTTDVENAATVILSLYTREKRYFKDMSAEIAKLNAEKQEAAAAAAAKKKKQQQQVAQAQAGGGAAGGGSRTSSPRIITAAALMGRQPSSSSRAGSKSSSSAPGSTLASKSASPRPTDAGSVRQADRSRADKHTRSNGSSSRDERDRTRDSDRDRTRDRSRDSDRDRDRGARPREQRRVDRGRRERSVERGRRGGRGRSRSPPPRRSTDHRSRR